MLAPKIGTRALYTLTADDAQIINERRRAGVDFSQGGSIGNRAEAGQTFPATIVRLFDSGETGVCNLQVTLDGNDAHWVTSAHCGGGEGKWLFASLPV